MRIDKFVWLFVFVSMAGLANESCRAAHVFASFNGIECLNPTQCLQRAFDTKCDTVIVADHGIWNIGPVFINRDNLTVILNKDLVLIAKSRSYDLNDCVLNISPNANYPHVRRNISIYGNGATIRMRKNEYREKILNEFRYCLSINNATNIKIDGLILENSGGDGVFIGDDAPDNLEKQHYCQDIVVSNCIMNNNKRQGISIISCRNLLIKNCILKNTNGTNPSAGIDLEPDLPFEEITNCVIENCFITDNAGPGIQIYLAKKKTNQRPISVIVKECVIKNNANGLFIYTSNDSDAKSNIIIKGCVVYNNSNAITYSGSNRSNTIVSNCLFLNNVFFKQKSVFVFDLTYNRFPIGRVQDFGGITFDNCYVKEPRSCNLITFNGQNSSQYNRITLPKSKFVCCPNVHIDGNVFELRPVYIENRQLFESGKRDYRYRLRKIKDNLDILYDSRLSADFPINVVHVSTTNKYFELPLFADGLYTVEIPQFFISAFNSKSISIF